MKWLAKLFIPAPKKLAQMSAEKIGSTVNESGKQDAIAKYSLALKTGMAQMAELNDMLVDGKIDPSETERIAEILTPYFERVIDLI